METSIAIRRVPFRVNKWKEFTREIERAVDEISHLDSEIKKLEARGNAAHQPRLRELKRDTQEARSRRQRHPSRTAPHA